jgi:hypothetical protein
MTFLPAGSARHRADGFHQIQPVWLRQILQIRSRGTAMHTSTIFQHRLLTQRALNRLVGLGDTIHRHATVLPVVAEMESMEVVEGIALWVEWRFRAESSLAWKAPTLLSIAAIFARFTVPIQPSFQTEIG